MEKRTLTITINADWQGALRAAAQAGFTATAHQVETLNFETPSAFFGRLTARRGAILHVLQGAGEVPAREVAQPLGRDVKRVHQYAGVLVNLGLIERTERGGLLCPFDDIHVAMHLRRAAGRAPASCRVLKLPHALAFAALAETLDRALLLIPDATAVAATCVQVGERKSRGSDTAAQFPGT